MVELWMNRIVTIFVYPFIIKTVNPRKTPHLDALKQDESIDSSEVTEAKILELRNEISNCTPEEKKECVNIIENAIKKANWDAQVRLAQLGKEFEVVDTPKQNKWFDAIKQDFEEYVMTRKVMEVFEWMFDENIKSAWMTALSPNEMNALKLVWWNEFLELAFLPVQQAKKIINQNPISAILNMGEDEKENLKRAYDTMSEKRNSDLEKIALVKKNNPEIILDASIINSIIQGDFKKDDLNGKNTNDNEKIFKEVVNRTWEFKESINDIELSLWGIIKSDIAKNIFWELDFDVKETLEQWWVFWIIIALLSSWIPWLKDLLPQGATEKEKKRNKSISDLIAYSEEENSAIKWIFSEQEIKNIDSKKLAPFYDYLEEEKIEIDTDDFWKKLITWKTDTPQLSLLSQEYGDPLFVSDDGKNGWEWVINKLNALPMLANKKQVEKMQRELQASADSLPDIWDNSDMIAGREEPETLQKIEQEKIQKDEKQASTSSQALYPHAELKPTEENTKVAETPKQVTSESQPNTEEQNVQNQESDSPEQQETKNTWNENITEAQREAFMKHRDTAIKTAIESHNSLPIVIDYLGKRDSLLRLWIHAPKSIDFKDGNILLDANTYKVSFSPFTYTMFIVSKKIDDLRISWVSVWAKNLLLELKTDTHNRTQEKSLPKSRFIEIALWLTHNDKYSYTIPAEKNTSEINFQALKA